jgi:hypothetical protein
MSSSQKKRRPLRKLISLAVLAGTVVAVKNALKDKGGSYEPPAAAPPSSAPVPTPPVPNVKPVTAEDIVEERPVENLDEFADPVEPETASEPAPESAPEPPEENPTRLDLDAAGPLDEAADPDDLREAPGKIDPFGIR